MHDYDKIYSWNCPYCDILAKGWHGTLYRYPYEHGCSGCGKWYKVGLDKGKLYVTANMETLLKYMCGLALQQYHRLENVPGTLWEDKFSWCRNKIVGMLADRYAYIGSVNGLLKLDEL